MKNIFRRLILAAGFLMSTLNLGAYAAEPSQFKDGEKVLFLGDSITRAGGWYSMVSLFYETRFPDRHITWMNAGISGDTAAGALQRLQWDILDRKPDTVVIMFGMNEAGRPDLPGKIGSEDRVKLYHDTMVELVSKLKKAGVQVVLCTPSPSEATAQLPTEAKPEINAGLTRIAQVARELAAEYGLPLVDFNGPMNKIAVDFQKTNPSFTLIGNDRTHPGELGSTLMGSLFLQAQKVSSVVSETIIDASTRQLVSVQNAQVSELQVKEGQISFTLLEKALPVPFEGKSREALKLSPDNELEKAEKTMAAPREAHTNAGWHCLPVQEALNRLLLQVANLPDGRYELLIDGQSVGQWNHDELSRGVNLAGVRITPQYQQSLQVKKSHDQRHGLSSADRGVAFTKLYTLEPARVDINDKAAVKTVLDRLINDPEAPTNPSLAGGGFAQVMAKNYFKTLEKSEEMATALVAAEKEIDRTNKPVPHRYLLRLVQPLLTLEQRQVAFANRRSPEQFTKTAKELLELLVLDNAGLLRSNLRLRKGYQKVADLAKEKPVEAMEAWRDYFMEKMRNSQIEGLGVIPYNPAENEKTVARAEELMQGKLAEGLAPMQPGSVWLPITLKNNVISNPWRPALFEPLANAFLITGERRFLDKWLEYIDDWAMHEVGDASIAPTDFSDLTNAYVPQIRIVCSTLSSIARTLPRGKIDLPADTLARILTKLVRVYFPAGLIYFESNPQNWTPHTMPGYMDTAMLIEEFKATEYFFNRAKHRQETYNTIEFLSDGSETEHALWYNRNLWNGCSDVLDLAKDKRKASGFPRLSWQRFFSNPLWQDQQRRTLAARGRYMLQMLTPQSQNPLGNRNDHRVVPGILDGEEYSLFEVYSDLQVLTETLRGNTAFGLPDFTMSAFPYSGSWLMRTGWGKGAGYGHFFCSPFPAGGHALPEMKGNNGLYLSYAGQDILLAGGFGNYSYDRSPLRVDGQEQFSLAGIGHGGVGKGHKGFSVAYVDPQLRGWRSHSGMAFDFAEGLYDRPYGYSIDDHHDNGNYTADYLAERARAVITGVSHQRQVFFVRDANIWVVLDRIRSAVPHEYSLDWRLPVAPLRQFEGKPALNFKDKTFTPETIQVDAARQSVFTSGADMANLAIRQFGPPMEFATERNDGEAIKNDFTLRYKLYDFWRISGGWKSLGNDLVVSLIEVIPAGTGSQIQSIEPLGDGKTTRGFRAKLTDGQSLAFATASSGKAELKVGGLSAKAEALLVRNDSGLALGCESLEGREPATANFEFSTDRARKVSLTPIYATIEPVTIAPERNVIMGAEPVTLSCATEGVEIRYTIDGSEPNLQSPLYSGPFTVEGNLMVKARAFRPGLNRLPVTVACTHASVTKVAYYNLQKPLEPLAPLPLDDKKVKPGLKADYYQGDWRELIFYPEWIKPVKSVTVKNIFELCTPNPTTVFGWTYSGFLAVPEDGVYTFHGPEELVTSRQEPGYSLRLFVGQELNAVGRATGNLNEWYPATTRHAYGTWSIALKKGLHPFKVIYVDYRTDAVERMNHPGMRLNTVWDGKVPELLVSGPGIDSQSIPKAWLFSETNK